MHWCSSQSFDDGWPYKGDKCKAGMVNIDCLNICSLCYYFFYCYCYDDDDDDDDLLFLLLHLLLCSSFSSHYYYFDVQEQICEDSASFELSSVDLATAIEETTQLGVRLTEMVGTESDIGDTGDGATCELVFVL